MNFLGGNDHSEDVPVDISKPTEQCLLPCFPALTSASSDELREMSIQGNAECNRLNESAKNVCAERIKESLLDVKVERSGLADSDHPEVRSVGGKRSFSNSLGNHLNSPSQSVSSSYTRHEYWEFFDPFDDTEREVEFNCLRHDLIERPISSPLDYEFTSELEVDFPAKIRELKNIGDLDVSFPSFEKRRDFRQALDFGNETNTICV